MIALAALALAGIGLGAYLFGRSAVPEQVADTRPAVNTAVADPTAPPPTATVVPPTVDSEPSEAAARTQEIPSGPAPVDAAEPVAAAASAVAPAVVLITNELGQGSGIVYDEGLIVTNAHVVGQSIDVTVQLASGTKVPGVVLGADPQTDVAVVSIETDEEYGIAVLAPDSSVEVGQLAVAIGSPFGLDQTVTSGVVSAIGRVVANQAEDGTESIVAMIQTDAPINPGNSGGALADRQGRVIGMNTAIRTDGSGGNIGVGFAIPSDTARLIADRIVSDEPLDQGFLGISGETPTIGNAGALVVEVTPDSGADVGGIVPGDLIIEFNEREIRDMSDLAAAVRLQTPDVAATVKVLRNGEEVSLSVTLGRLGS